jgi:hypothetical protein
VVKSSNLFISNFNVSLAMKNFIKKITIFFLILLLLIIVPFVFLNIYHSLFFNEFKLSKNISTLFVGDSQIQTAINDELIKNSINIATSAESYYYSYYKLQKYLSQNPQIKRIYLGFSYHSLSNSYDDLIYGKQSGYISSGQFFNLPIEERFKCLIWNAKTLLFYLKKIFRAEIARIFSNHGVGYSNYFINTSASIKSIYKKLNSQFYTNGKVNDFSTVNLDYLDRIVSLCKAKKVDLVLLTTPLHSYFRDNVPDIYHHKYDEIINLYKLKLIDLSSIPLTDDDFIPDGVHVSQKGAVITTEEINNNELLLNNAPTKIHLNH